ncbi:MAG: MBL fold metallo-hydrolase [Prevotellaceae bacterium]|nr:MBL fold metallo-hydrolase [Prevotellaceae bacterium]
MRFISIGSGSSGNCYYFEHAGEGFLVDIGVGIRAFKKHMAGYGLALPRIKAIFVTHDHNDHVRAVGPMANELKVPVYASVRVHDAIRQSPYIRRKPQALLCQPFQPGETIVCGSFTLETFCVPHDSTENIGYFISCEEKKICLMTDIGAYTEEMKSYIKKADYLIVEANYDPEMLQHGPYPAYLKVRITSGTGHSSNRETAEMLRECLSPSAKHVWLCHLSAENNTPQKVVEAMSGISICPVDPLPRTVPSGLIEL